MARSRPEKTLADYAAIAISPALIMLLVGSLVFFLLEVTYGGVHAGRLRWILFWFVFATVLVSRIGIEQGRDYARIYGLVLAAATALVIFRFVESFALGAIGLLAVVWWCTNKLTWDCTLIDDDEDASGQGLLQVAGFDETPATTDEQENGAPGRSGDTRAVEPAETIPGAAEEPDKSGHYEPAPWWHRLRDRDADHQKKPHAPGVWVVYFSLAALPLFGVGQVLIPAAETARRAFAFQLLWVYVAAALGLLLTTSFLGLRRYLRQRKLTMPAAMTAAWLGMGAVLALLVLALCVLLPRPDGEYSIPGLIDKLSVKAQKASRIAFLREDSGEGDGDRSGKPDPDNEDQPDDDQGQGDAGGAKDRDDLDKGDGRGRNKKDAKAKDEGRGGGGKGSAKGKGEGKKGQGEQKGKAQGQGDRDDKQDDDKAGRNDQTKGRGKGQQSEEGSPPPANSSNPAQWIGNGVKWLIYLVLAVIGLILLIKNRSKVAEFFRRLIEELRNLWAGLFGGRKKETETGGPDDPAARAAARRPFASYANPFVTGTAYQMKPAAVVIYTFEALEAWAREHGLERHPDQTPLEFARLLADNAPELGDEARQTARLYTRIAYADRSPSSECLSTLERLWRRMEESALTGVGVAGTGRTGSSVLAD